MTAKATDRPRLQLEDALAAVCEADECARVAALRLTNRARTDEEAEIIQEILGVRIALREVRHYLRSYHPQGCGE